MNGVIGHRGREMAASGTLFPAPDADGMPDCVLFRRRRTAPAGFSIALFWLATTGTAIAAPAASWSLLPQPAHVRLAACIFATGDPRDGQWALARMALSK
jgi:hypothetical protein